MESMNLFYHDVSTESLKFIQVICHILHVTPRLGVVGITNAISINKDEIHNIWMILKAVQYNLAQHIVLVMMNISIFAELPTGGHHYHSHHMGPNLFLYHSRW